MEIALLLMSMIVGGVSQVCVESKVQTLLVGLNVTLLLVVERKEPIDSSSSTAIKLEALNPKEISSQSISKSASVSKIACVSLSAFRKGVLPSQVVSLTIF